MSEVTASVLIRRELNDAAVRNERFLKSLYRTYPECAPASVKAANEEEARRLAQRWFAQRRALRESRDVAFSHTGTISQSIINSVATSYGVKPELLMGRSRKQKLVRARYVAMRLLRDVKWSDGRVRFSVPTIGLMFGRDHSSVSYALQQFDDMADRDDQMRAVYEILSEQMAA